MGAFWVALGGAIGSAARYGVNIIAPRFLGTSFPWATLVVNVVGCFAMGYLTAMLRQKFADDEHMRLFLTTGMLGGFTTFSALCSAVKCRWRWVMLLVRLCCPSLR
jgi:fluoride exporter